MTRQRNKSIFITVALVAASVFCGCLSTKINYDKIPLATGDEPYILASGDYMDNKGFLHVGQTNVWALSQKDVYDYVRWLRDHKRSVPRGLE